MELTMIKLIVKTKRINGKETFYPVCKNSKLLVQLAGTKTITDRVLKIINELGYICFDEKG